MKRKDDTTDREPPPELQEIQKIMREHVRQYAFHNDHIMRGPLCRVMGLIDLLRRENLTPETRKLLDMLVYEVRQMENVTFMISKMLDTHEQNLDDSVDD